MATREATSARGEAHRRRMEGAARRAARAGSAGVLGFQRVVAGRERDVAEDGPDHAVQVLVELAERVGGRERVVENAAVVGGVDLRCARTPEHAGSGYVWVLHCNAAALLQSKHCRKLVWLWRRLKRAARGPGMCGQKRFEAPDGRVHAAAARPRGAGAARRRVLWPRERGAAIVVFVVFF